MGLIDKSHPSPITPEYSGQAITHHSSLITPEYSGQAITHHSSPITDHKKANG
ncbi:MAG: hypothetical protein PHP31_05705 [Lentimicrobiaceae bacterium]|nr:hypothetical protein [Lentimicrobiaceae bacterium]